MAATTVPLSNWADELMVSVPGCTQPAAEQALTATLREFYVQSGAWVRELRPINIIADKTDYYLDPQTDGSILYIHSIMYQSDPQQGDNQGYNRMLTPMQAPSIRLRTSVPSNQPWGFVGDADIGGKFTLRPTVNLDIPKALIPYVAMGLKQQFDGRVPESTHRWHFDKILDGAKGRLMMTPDKPYTNLQLAQYHSRRFRSGMAQARDMARRQFTNAESDFAMNWWGG